MGRFRRAWLAFTGKDIDGPVISRLVAKGYLYLNPNVGWVWNKELP